MQDKFLELVQSDWELANESTLPTKGQPYYKAIFKRADELIDHWHWRKVVEDTITVLYNASERQRLFGIVKSIAYKSKKLQFGERRWMQAVFATLTNEFNLVYMNPKQPFWTSVGGIPANAYELYKDQSIPVFSDTANNRLRLNKANKERWMKLLKIYYSEYFTRFSRIYLIVDPNDETQPKYQLKKSIAIDMDQRVFLAENLNDGTLMVVKWTEDTSEALESWSLVRDAGVPMLHFQTNYVLFDQEPVLLMERLFPIDATDSSYELLLDILPQLQTLHRAGIVHADLKLDNIMKRVQDGKLTYFVIDYDSISKVPINGIQDAVKRKSYSPLWASQILGLGDHPTSYRYDLEELFYAIVDLAKQKFRKARKARELAGYPRFPIYDDQTEARILVQRGLDFRTLLSHTHQTRVLDDNVLTKLFPMIMNLPERLPFEQIDHTKLIQYIRQGSQMQQKISTPQYNCAICEAPAIDAIHTVDDSNSAVVVCGIVCAALVNHELHREEAEKYRAITRRVRSSPECVQCGNPPQFKCDACRIPYCSSNCQKEHWERHKKICK